MTISPGFAEYDPDGGGGLAVTAQYSYGGYRTVGGRKVGYHNVLFNVIYDSNLSTTSGATVEVGAEYKGVSAAASASSSLTLSKAALSFVREIAFHSYEI